MNTSLRGSGRTRAALSIIPRNATYVWPNDAFDYPEELLRYINRIDVDIVSCRFVERGKFRPIRGGVFFDHAVDMRMFREETIQMVEYHNYKYSEWGPFMHVRFWNDADQRMFIRLVRSGLKEQQAVEQMEMIGIKAMNKDFTNREGLVGTEPKVNFPPYHYNRRW